MIKGGDFMNETFDGLKKYSDKDKSEMLNNSIIVLDTNILLDLYRLSSDASTQLINALMAYKENIWLPYYAGVEFYKNKENVIHDKITQFDKIIKDGKNRYNKIIEDISHSFKEFKDNSEFKTLLDNFKENKNVFEKLDKFNNNNNTNYSSSTKLIDKKIEELIGNKITEKIEYDDNFNSILKEGHNRIEKEMPPGYKDKGKCEYIGDYQVNGDYIIFYTMIKLSCEKNIDIIFITGDNKPDWYDKDKGSIRFELQKEFFIKTGHKIVLLTRADFIDLYNKNTKEKEDKISKEIKQKIKNLESNCDDNSYDESLLLKYLDNYKDIRENVSMPKKVEIEKSLLRNEIMHYILENDNYNYKKMKLVELILNGVLNNSNSKSNSDLNQNDD